MFHLGRKTAFATVLTCTTGAVAYRNYFYSHEVDIAVLGGGMGGLAVCAALRRNGFDAHVFEGASALRTDSGTIMSLADHALVALKTVHPELPSRVRSAGLDPTTVTFANKELESAGAKSVAQPAMFRFTVICWATMQRLLAELIPSSAVHCACRVTRVVPDCGDSRAEVFFAPRPLLSGLLTIPQPSVRAKLVIGADGIHSRTRECVAPDAAPRYCGNLNWNAVVPNDLLRDQTYTASNGEVMIGASRALSQEPNAIGWITNRCAPHSWCRFAPSLSAASSRPPLTPSSTLLRTSSMLATTRFGRQNSLSCMFQQGRPSNM